MTRKAERVHIISDSHADSFAMFRYELNSIFRQHQFLDENHNDPRFMGRNPLSKALNGKQLKDLDDNLKMQYLDMFRPPGVVRLKEGRFLQGKSNP